MFFSKEEDGYCAQVVRKKQLGPHVEFQKWCTHFGIKIGGIHQFSKGDPSKEGMGFHFTKWIQTLWKGWVSF